MHFVIKISTPNPAGWRVGIEAEIAAPPPSRTMRRIGHSPNGFPLPPTEDLPDLPVDLTTLPDELKYLQLSGATDAKIISDSLKRIIGKTPLQNEVKIFGQYLFTALLGNDVWQKIKTAAAGDFIEIELVFDQAELARLPWEAMHDGGNFITVERKVSITRLVAGGDLSAQKIRLRPRVLFVIGTDINEKSIRPGAEFLGALKSVKVQNGIRLSSHLVQNATSAKIEESLTKYQPSIVHFICHGGVDSTGGFLKIKKKDDSPEESILRGADLIRLLKLKTGEPPIVVLSACDSAKENSAVNVAPLVVELVKAGIPVAVGMGGRVADTACRLFTRQFYAALLKGEPIAAAVAAGRRAGILHLSEMGKTAENAIDWALPTLFAAEGALARIELDNDWMERQKQLENFAKVFGWKSPPSTFCSNYEIFDGFRELLDVENNDFQIMAISVNSWDAGFISPRYGKSRILHELATYAAHHGHIPCLVSFGGEESPNFPKNELEIGDRIKQAIITSRKSLDLNPSVMEFARLASFYRTSSVALHPNVQIAIDNEMTRGETIRAALQIDLLSLLADARAKFGADAANLKVVVMIDDVHGFDDGARVLVKEMLDFNGFGDNKNQIPVVLAYSTKTRRTEDYINTIEILKNSLAQKIYVRLFELRTLQPPDKDWLAYQQFLLSQGLIIKSEVEEDAKDLYDSFYEETRGVPSEFNNQGVAAVVKYLRKIDELIAPDDEKLLARNEF